MTEPQLARPPLLAPHAVRGIIFDLDGTLVDSYSAITSSLNHARAEFELPPLTAGEVRPRVGRGLATLIAELVGPERTARGVELFRQRYAELFAGETFALPAARETLMRLHARGYRMAVASNKPARFSEPILHRLGMLGFLETVLGPETAGRPKPEPQMIWLCLQRLGLERVSALYVGDMVLDVETGARAGLPVALVVGGSSDEAELRRTDQPVLRSLGELCELLPDPAPAAT